MNSLVIFLSILYLILLGSVIYLKNTYEEIIEINHQIRQIQDQMLQNKDKMLQNREQMRQKKEKVIQKQLKLINNLKNQLDKKNNK